MPNDTNCAYCGKKLVVDRATDTNTGWEFHPDCLKKYVAYRNEVTGNGPVAEKAEKTSKKDSKDSKE